MAIDNCQVYLVNAVNFCCRNYLTKLSHNLSHNLIKFVSQFGKIVSQLGILKKMSQNGFRIYDPRVDNTTAMKGQMGITLNYGPFLAKPKVRQKYIYIHIYISTTH